MVTSNRPLSGWDEVFPNTTCVASIVGRLHLADVISIDGESYALNEGPSRKSSSCFPTDRATGAASCPMAGRPARRSPGTNCAVTCGKTSARSKWARCQHLHKPT
nr:hypothetical protein [Burkholderia gladioli]